MSHRNQSIINLPAKPLLIVLSGTSGVGKDAVLTRLKELNRSIEHVTTVTTRPRRAKEKDNVDYHFISTEKFQELIENNDLLEWAEVYGNFYGVPKKPVKQALESGKDTIVKVDVQGAATIKKILPQAVFIFLVPPSMEELVLRLKQRGTESPSDLALRVRVAEEEMEHFDLFDYVVFNRRGEIARAVSDIGAIITAEKCRVSQREVKL